MISATVYARLHYFADESNFFIEINNISDPQHLEQDLSSMSLAGEPTL